MVFFGLFLVVAGSGLLKPNISVMVGKLYDDDTDARRDAGFSVFYMGINLGAFLGILITPFLAGDDRWHLGFGAAAREGHGPLATTAPPPEPEYERGEPD
jgi:POT family proton-dependent oligopeptide transporter